MPRYVIPPVDQLFTSIGSFRMLFSFVSLKDEILRDAVPKGEPQNVRPPTEKPGTFVESAENAELKHSAYANSATIDPPAQGTLVPPHEDQSIRGKLR